MRPTVSLVGSLSTNAGDLVAVVCQNPFDRAPADLGIDLTAAAALCAEAKRVAFRGDVSEAVTVSDGGRWFALIGAGPSPKTTDFRRVGARAVRLGKQLGVERIAIVGVRSADRARFAAEGVALAAWTFDRYKTERPELADRPKLTRVDLVGGSELQPAIALGNEVAAAVAFARELANEHPGRCTPMFLADQARELATQHGFGCRIFDEDELREANFDLLLAVSRGSEQPPRMIHLTYTPKGEIRRRIALVGKGVTYDSGGYSLKIGDHQIGMHLDMGGAAAVLGAADAIGRTRPEGVEVHFIVPATENLVSGRAYKLNEVIRSRSGTTVEILNTDAEGRLILADAISYALEQDPDEIIDLATLTGSCVVALGTETAGLFSNDDGVAARLIETAGCVDESIWRLPLTPRIEDHLKSDIADLKNVGSRWGGAISAALFLKRFAGDCPWAHIDIAGPAMTDGEWEHINKGGTGFGVTLLHEYARRAGASRS